MGNGLNDIDCGPANSITRRIAFAGFILAILVGALLASGDVSQIVFAFAASLRSQQVMLCLIGALNSGLWRDRLLSSAGREAVHDGIADAVMIVRGIFEIVYALQLRGSVGWQAIHCRTNFSVTGK